MVEGVNRVVGKGVVSNIVGVKANTKVVWADYGYDGVTYLSVSLNSQRPVRLQE